MPKASVYKLAKGLNKTVFEGAFFDNPGYHRQHCLTGGYSMSQERRRSPRYPFFAAAELVEDASQVRLTTHLSELSMFGCYLDIMNPFPAGSSVRITISDGPASIQCNAKVVYSQANMGMGVAWEQLEEKYTKVLEAWMERAKNN